MLTDIADILTRAGEKLLLPAFAKMEKSVHRKTDGSLVTQTDRACQSWIRGQLAAAWPDIGFLGEEMNRKTQHDRLRAGGRCWCLDPLDGTTNFIASFPAFALSLALMEDNQPRLACIHDPIRGETFTARKNDGAWCNGAPIAAKTTSALSDAVGFVDFKRLNEKLRRRLSAPGVYRSQRNIGSCALEWAWLAAGRSQFIAHGGEMIWDYAAGGLLAGEAGCAVTDFSGASPFARAAPSSSILAAASASLHNELSALVHGQTPDPNFS